MNKWLKENCIINDLVFFFFLFFFFFLKKKILFWVKGKKKRGENIT